jgi:tetratricopeptide (TPR) repeat protein
MQLKLSALARCLSLAALVSVGCSSREIRADAVSAPDTGARQRIGERQKSKAVLDYEPGSEAEKTAMAEIERADSDARAQIAPAMEEAVEASDRFGLAQGRAKIEKSLEDKKTKEQLEHLYKLAETNYKNYVAHISEQAAEYDKFLKKYPSNWLVRHHYADFLADNFRPDEAAAQWRKVIELEPRFPYAHNSLGTLYNHMGRDLEAVLLYRRAIELMDTDPNFYINLAVNYSTHRDEVSKEFGWDLPRVFRECLAAYRKALSLEPQNAEIARDIATQYVLARFFNVQNTEDEAIEAWKYYANLDIKPFQKGVAYRSIGSIYLRQKHDKADRKSVV